MTAIIIRYESPKGDPFKVPRPHRVTIGSDGAASLPVGGEAGVVTELLGFSRRLNSSTLDFANKLEWREASELYDGDAEPDDLKGWYPAFVGPDGPFTYAGKIKLIEVVQ